MLARIRDGALPAVAWIWLGIVVGVAFIAIPSHFRSTLLERGEVLDVNRHTFTLANQVELALCVLLLGLLAWRGAGRWLWAIGAVTVVIVAAQGLWLIPELAARGDMVIAGQTPPPSPLHGIAVGAEGTKMAALAIVAIACSRKSGAIASAKGTFL